jgi:hypothetical protein
MYFKDHFPPHFHVRYGEFLAGIRIDDFMVIEGDLPPRVLGMVFEWADIHHDELMFNWNSARERGTLKPIQPLQ